MLKRKLLVVLAIASMGLSPQAALGNGFFINQQSVVGFGRADAGNAAAALDPSTVFFNPAGMTELWNDQPADTNTIVSSGAHLILGRSKYTNKGSTVATPGSGGAPVPVGGPNQKNPVDPTPVLNSYAVHRLEGGDLYLGVGISAPFGLASEFDGNWFARYDSIEAKLLTVNLGPVVAYRVNSMISVGGGIDVQYARATISQALPDPFAIGGASLATDGLSKAEADSWAVGFNVGILLKLTSTFRVGLHYRSEMDHDFDGNVTTSGFAGFAAAFNGKLPASAKVDLPAIASLAGVYQVNPRLSLFGDLTWYQWSDQKEIRFVFDDNTVPDAVRPTHYRDSYTVGLGFEYIWSPDLTLRSGFRYDRTPTVDATRDTTFPDSDRYWLSIGGTQRISENLVFDFAYAHVFLEETFFDVERKFYEGTVLDSTARIAGQVEGVSDNISINFRYSY